MKTRIFALLLILTLLAAPFAALAEEAAQEAPAPEPTAADTSDNIVTTKHTAVIQGKELAYTANAGTVVLETGGETCEIFFTAYTLDGVEDPSTRPVTFAFNGGPGACSMYLHVGCLGPRRVDFNDNGYVTSLPAQMKDNDNSLLDLTDIVFIDAPGTGYSGPVGASELSAFVGYANDIRTFSDFIYQYVDRNGRWGSKKYLAGESYGTARAVGISSYLARAYNMNLNGLMLISSINDVSTIMSEELPYATFLPTFAADAWYHGRVDEAYRDMALEDYLEVVRAFVEDEYVPALFKGNALTEDEMDALAGKYAGFTGLPKENVLRDNLRVEMETFCVELLEDQKQTIGRYDGRITGPSISGSLLNGASDPSDAAFGLGFGNTFNEYLTKELGFKTDKKYIPMNGDVNGAWTFGIESWGGYMSQEQTIKDCMSKNPFLKIWVLCGYYDAATPFYSAEWVFRHVFLDEGNKGNVSFTYYPCGHMIYMEKESFDKFRRDAEAWYE